MYVINSKRFKKKILPEIPKGCAFATKIHPRWNKNNTYYGTNNFKLDFRPSGCLARITIFESSEYWNYSYLGSEFDIWLRGTWNNANAQTLWNSNLWFFKWVGSGGGVTTSFATKNCAYSIRACKTYEGEDVPDGTIFSNAYTDGDGNNYNAVKIGTQLWITENLKTTKFQDGTPITLGTSVSDFQYNDTTPLYTFYEYNTKGTTYKDAYGGLYNWYCVNNNIVSGDSWNVCSGNDLNTLKEYLINTKWRDEVITTNNIGRYVRSCRQVDHPLDIYFKTTWNIPSSGYSFTYPVASYEDGNYNYSIDWGDNTEVEDYYDDTPPTHIYEKAGNYTIKVSGSLPRFAIANGSMKSLLLGVENWGDVGFKSMAYMFQGVTNNIEIPNTLTGHKDVTSMEGMFFSATTFNGDISNWDVSNITNMSYMFRYATNFNQNIGNWNVGNVTNMVYMFANIKFNKDIGNWNVSKVTNMSNMFYNASNFNQDIGNWNVSNVTNMAQTFRLAQSFNQDIGNWNVSAVTNMTAMFRNSSFNQYIGDWNVSKVIGMSYMFYSATNFNQNIGNWNVGNVTNMSNMFYNAFNFNQDIGNWDVSNVTNMDGMFAKCESFNQDLSWWCVTNISTKPLDFDYGCISWILPQPDWGNCPEENVFKTTWNIPTNKFNLTFPIVSRGRYDYYINWGDGSPDEYYNDDTPPEHGYHDLGIYTIRVWGKLTDIVADEYSQGDLLLGVDNWGDVDFRTMKFMFKNTGDIYLPNNLTGHDRVESMEGMFLNSEFNADISNWDVSNITNMDFMFSGATNFNQDLSGWCVENITREPRDFYNGSIWHPSLQPQWGEPC